MPDPAPGLCSHDDCQPEPLPAKVIRDLGGPHAPPPFLLCASHQWTDALARCDGDDRAALDLITLADTPIAGQERERPMLLLAADPATGMVLGAWLDVAYGPAGLVAQVNDRRAAGNPALRRDPARYWVADVAYDSQGPHIHLNAGAALEAAAGHAGRRAHVASDLDLARRVPLADRHAAQVALILGEQATAIAAEPRAVFHGIPDGHIPGSGTVAIETSAAGAFIMPLANARLVNSPDGHGWGYGGSAPHALAASLLAAALGSDAACPACDGHRRITVTDHEQPGELIEWSWTPGDDPDAVMACPDCDDGLRKLPVHAYARSVVAALDPAQPFWIGRADVLAWLAGIGCSADSEFAALRDAAETALQELT